MVATYSNSDTASVSTPRTESDTVSVHDLNEGISPNSPVKKRGLMKFLGIILVIILGVSTGYVLAGKTSLTAVSQLPLSPKSNPPATTGSAKVVGSGCNNTDTFSDEATGELAVNDQSVVQEGTHILIRPGGKDQTVYLFSSVMDLDPYIGRQVTVRGETFSAKKAGWLMDVGCVELR